MIFILDKHETMVGVLNNSTPSSCPYFDDLHTENIETGVHTYSFSVPAAHKTAESLEVEGYVIRPDLDNRLQMFKIIDIKETASDSELVKEVSTEHIAVPELLRNVVRPGTYNGRTVKQAVEIVLGNTGWNAGEIDFIGVKDIVFEDYMTAREALLQVVETFDAEIQYEVVFKNGVIQKRLVHVTKQRGTVTNKRFEYKKDLQDVTRTVNSEGIVTALVAVGKGDTEGERLTLVNYDPSTDTQYGAAGALPKGFVKPITADWVGNEEALQLYGKNGKHIFGIYQDENAVNIQELLQNAIAELKERMKPSTSYDMSVATLERLSGYEAERVRIGDTIIANDTSFTPRLLVEARVIELQRSYTEPENDKVTLGDYRPIKINNYDLVENLQKKITANEEKWNQSGITEKQVNNIISTEIEPVKQSVSDVQTDVSGVKTDVSEVKQSIAVYDKDLQLIQGDVEEVKQEVKDKEYAIIRQTDKPEGTDFIVGQLWLDDNNDFYKFTGTDWEKISKSTAEDLGAVPVTTYTTDIEDLEKSISLRVSQTTYDADIPNLKTRMSSAESSITANADSIKSKVSTTDFTGTKIVSLIEQTPDNVRISAKNIDLEGKVTISMLNDEVQYKMNRGTVGGIVVGGAYTGAFKINTARSGVANAGEIKVYPGTFTHPNGKSWEHPIESAGSELSTLLEGSNTDTEAYLIFVGSDISRITNTAALDPLFAVAKYSGGTWYYQDNSSWKVFIPNEDDCIIGKLTRDSSSSAGIKDLALYCATEPTKFSGATEINGDNIKTGKISAIDIEGVNIKGSVLETTQTADNQVHNARFEGTSFTFIKFKSGITNPDTVNPVSSQIESLVKVFQDGIGFANDSKSLLIGLDNFVASGDLYMYANKFVFSPIVETTFTGNTTFIDGVSILGGMNSDLDMKNHNLSNVNHITINDPGGGEGIEWLNGNGWKIVEAPYGLSNSSGDLQFATYSKSQFTITTGGSVWAQGHFHSRTTGNAYFVSNGTTILKSDAANSGSGIYVGNDGKPRIWSTDIYNRTYSASANVHITSAGTLGRTSSARKYKLDIEDVEEDIPDKLLDVNPRTWYDRSASEAYAEYLQKLAGVNRDGTPAEFDEPPMLEDIPYLERIPGLIAEEVEAAGLERYVVYGEPDENGVRHPESLMYDRLWTLLIPIARKQREQIAALEQRIQKLESGGM